MSQTMGLRADWVLAWENGGPALRRDAVVVVEQGRVQAVLGAGEPVPADTMDLGPSLLLPGFVNTHTHCVSGPLFRALIEDRSYDEGSGGVIDAIMLPLGEIMGEVLDPDEVRAVAALGLVEALKAGSTAIVDMPRSGHDEVAHAVREMGIRAWIHPYLMSGAGADWGWSTESGQDPDVARAMAVFHRWHERHDQGAGGRIRIGLGPHAPDTCAPALLRAVARTRDELRCRVTLHLAQSSQELERIGGRFRTSPVQYLDRLGVLDAGLIAAHCVYAERSDLVLLAERGVTIAHCPLSYARMGRLAARSRFTAAGVRATVASDAHSLDIVADLRLAAINSKIDSGRCDYGTAWEVVRAATADAADALGRSDLGRIAPGAVADLVGVRLDRAHLQPVRDPVKALVWNGSGRDVDFVMVDGEVLVRGGSYARAREADVVAAGARALYRVWDKAEQRGLLR